MAATKTAESARRRATPAKANGAGRTATEQPSAVNGTGNEPAVLEEILDALVAARDGDFSRRLSRRRRGLLGEIARRLQRAGLHERAAWRRSSGGCGA